MKIIEGKLLAEGLKMAVIVSRFNDLVSARLAEGAADAFRRHGGNEKDLDIVKVPGSFEIPAAAARAARLSYDAVICLGAVIRGDTPHFDFVASEAAKGIAQVSLETGKPVIYGVITADTLEQALERAGAKQGNKGFDAAVSAIEMANLFKAMK